MTVVIGVLPLWDEEKNSLWMLPGYMNGIAQAGGLPVMLPLTAETSALEALDALCAGFLFTGGQDISPHWYGEEKKPLCGEICDTRDRMEAFLFARVLERDKPALGICRGIQLFNALLGGDLYQDVPAQLGEGVRHRAGASQAAPAVHPADIVPGSPLHKLLKAETVVVNSDHHQGIRRISPRLEAMARAKDGLVEAVRVPEKGFIWAVQWHPELWLQDQHSRALFQAFADACASGAGPRIIA
jgi:putative glutamine amidotransferase